MPEATPQGALSPAPMTISQAAAKLEERRAAPAQQDKPAQEAPAKPEQETPAQDTQDTDKTQDAPETDAADAPTPADDAQQPPQEALDLTAIAAKLGVEPEKLYDLEFPTKIDGQDGKATIRQALKNYQLEGHLIGKQREFAEQRKAFDTEREQATQAITTRQQELESALNVAARFLHGQYANVDWAKLEAEDPIGFLTTKHQFEQHRAQLQQAFGALQKGTEEQQKQLKQRFDTWATNEAKQLVTKVPEWADPKAAERGIQQMNKDAAEAYGFTPDELGQLFDHRHVLVLRDALKFRALEAQQPAVMARINKAPVLAKPGTAGKPNSAPAKEARANLSRTHSVGDAVSALMARRQQTRK